MSDTDRLITQRASSLHTQIRRHAQQDITEKAFREPVEKLLAAFAEEADITLRTRDEYTLVDAGRADTVYNRLVIEYERPGFLKDDNSAASNRHAIQQVKDYIEAISHEHHHKIARLAGVVLDGRQIIFVSHVNEAWYIEAPLPFNERTLTRLLKLLVKTSTGVALIPENLIEDFKGLQAERAARAFYEALAGKTNADNLTGKLFRQWQTFFGQVTGYEEGSARLKDKKELRKFAKDMGISPDEADPPRLFFSIHTYFAVLIKLIAWLTLSRYMPEAGPAFVALQDLSGEELRKKLTAMERGGVFREYNIRNFLEADFFGWYLSAWNKDIERQLKNVIKTLAQYDPETLEVSPEQTRDLLKKLYHYLMPRELRHDLGEYYTPDWLAERLLTQLDYRLFQSLDKPAARRETLAYAKKELLRLRFLDPACGSGTFLVLIISRIRQLAEMLDIPLRDVLNVLQRNVVGIDLNPLAAIAARTNYLLALGELLTLPGRGTITIPVYLADSIVPPGPGRTLEDAGTFPIPTTVGRFRVPEAFGTRQRLDALTDALDEAVQAEQPVQAFLGAMRAKVDLSDDTWENTEHALAALYKQMLDLHKHGLNGVWARIIRNAFAPLFIGKFDYVAGNPPWVRWQYLPTEYRERTKALWFDYGLFSLKGYEARLGGGEKDFSILFVYACADRFLNSGGKLGFVITQIVFQAKGAGEGFRRFQIGVDGEHLCPLYVDDMVELQPFENASNKTSVLILQKGLQPRYPVTYVVWQKKPRFSCDTDLSLGDVIDGTTRTIKQATPVGGEITAPWQTFAKKLGSAIDKVFGESVYEAHIGARTDPYGVFWVEILGKPDPNKVIVRNMAELGKTDIPTIQTSMEPDLLYPGARGADIKKWCTIPSGYIPMVQDPNRRLAIEERVLRSRYPLTHQYFQRFEKYLRARGSRTVQAVMEQSAFYAMFAVGTYTYAPYKVGWRRMGNTFMGAVLPVINDRFVGRKCVIPIDTVTFVAVDSDDEAHYLCALMNSSVVNFAIGSFSAAGRGFGSPSVLSQLAIPAFKASNMNHMRLGKLSQKAHALAAEIYAEDTSDAAREKAEAKLREVEEEVDERAAELWGLTQAELKEIKKSLEELG